MYVAPIYSKIGSSEGVIHKPCDMEGGRGRGLAIVVFIPLKGNHYLVNKNVQLSAKIRSIIICEITY